MINFHSSCLFSLSVLYFKFEKQTNSYRRTDGTLPNPVSHTICIYLWRSRRHGIRTWESPLAYTQNSTTNAATDVTVQKKPNTPGIGETHTYPATYYTTQQVHRTGLESAVFATVSDTELASKYDLRAPPRTWNRMSDTHTYTRQCAPHRPLNSLQTRLAMD